jgi:hypothetical protein
MFVRWSRYWVARLIPFPPGRCANVVYCTNYLNHGSAVFGGAGAGTGGAGAHGAGTDGAGTDGAGTDGAGTDGGGIDGAGGSVSSVERTFVIQIDSSGARDPVLALAVRVDPVSARMMVSIKSDDFIL